MQLAKKYMKRVASELDILSSPDKEPMREFLILQGVRFAFRVHQVPFDPPRLFVLVAGVSLLHSLSTSQTQ